jgi:phosphoserine phosphatase RsbU/P
VLRGQVADIITGTVFVFIGLAACGVAAMRRRSGVRVLLWLGIWSTLYGSRPLLDPLATAGILPHWFQPIVPYIDIAAMYLVLVVGMLAFLELSVGKMRIFVLGVAFAGLAIALAGIGLFVFTGDNTRLISYNSLLATCASFVLATVVAVPGLSRKFMVLPARGVLLVGVLVFAAEALLNNLVRPLGYRLPLFWGSLGFAVLLFSFGYVALQMVFASERRLLSIESELATAREIQASILPRGSPDTENLRIAAAYRPMTEVAGDFYDFIPVELNRIGFLIADASGHGVPAALIAAMIKVAMQSIVSCAHDPRAVLSGLNHVLSGQLRDQFVTAAYLWLDMENRTAKYSAAGHPPLLLWREGKLQRIESNGLVFGVVADPDYPVCEMPVKSGDRFVLYTDGVVEAENVRGEAFGDHKLEEVIRKNRSRSPSELVDGLLSEIRHWRPASAPQQDDITFIVIDVV